jgi:hypothetical protein
MLDGNLYILRRETSTPESTCRNDAFRRLQVTKLSADRDHCFCSRSSTPKSTTWPTAAGYSPQQIEGFAAVVEKRIAELNQL